MLDKPFDRITAGDIEDLCAHGAYENQLLEFKRELPEERGRADPWMNGGDFTAHARDRLFREIVAFANAQGGTLVLGIEETKNKPPRAARICPLPRIHELATSIEDAARARIDPVLPGLHVRGIDIDGTGGGVLIFRTAASLSGPHRIQSEGHVYIRRGAVSEKMTMREIQDLTIDLARGAERIDALFLQRATGFVEWLQRAEGANAAWRITAAPLGRFPGLPRSSNDPNAFPIPDRYNASYGDAPISLIVPSHGRTRPIIRGIRKLAPDDSTRIDILQSGVIDLWRRHQLEGSIVYMGWLLGAYVAVLDLIDRARVMANVPDWEYGIELSLGGLTDTPRFSGGRVPLPEFPLGGLNDPHSKWRIDELPVTFPRIPYRNRENRNSVINLVLCDLIDAAGSLSGPLSLKLDN